MMTESSILLYVVDDEPCISSSFLSFFEDYSDLQAVAFSSAEAAIEAMEQRQPHICIVDMRLPGMGGEEFVTNARAICPECRFLVHTGSIDMALTPRLEQAGLVEADVFYKPADMRKVLKRIRQLFGIKGE